jgi:hypothetical protein
MSSRLGVSRPPVLLVAIKGVGVGVQSEDEVGSPKLGGISKGNDVRDVNRMASDNTNAPPRWRQWAELGEMVNGPDDPAWTEDRSRVAYAVRDQGDGPSITDSGDDPIGLARRHILLE